MATLIDDDGRVPADVVRPQPAGHRPCGGIAPGLPRADPGALGDLIRRASGQDAVGFDGLDAVAVRRG